MTNIQLNEAAEAIAGENGNRLKVTLTCISELRGTYPDIALPEDVDRAAIGDDAFFVTLPIGQAGARSRNQRTYSRAAVEQMVAQINAKRPEGAWGHVAPDEAGTKYDPPAIRWLAAAIDAEGIAWGKGLPLTEATREYYRLAKATNARVGTSLVAWAQMDGDEVKALELVTVDLADPARVGVPITAARAQISQEMEEQGSTEYRVLSTESKERDATQRRKGQEKDAKVGAQHAAPLQEQTLADLAEMVGAATGEDVIEQVRGLVAERDGLRESLRELAITAAVERAVRIPAAAALVEELVRGRIAERDPQTVEEIDAAVGSAVAAVIESAAVQTVLRAGLVEAMGSAQRRPVRREGEIGGVFRVLTSPPDPLSVRREGRKTKDSTQRH